MARFTHQVAVDRLDSAIRWLEDYGVSTSNTRLAQYMKLLTMESTVEEGTDRLLNAILEMNEICDIHEGFDGVQLGDAYIKKLQQYCAGPEEYLKEPKRKHNQSRDIGFELAIASQFSRCGFDVETSLDDVDVATTHGGHKWLIECKRPRYDHSVRSSVTGAYKQLKSRSDKTSELNYGLVAVSFTKVIMQESLLGVDGTMVLTEGIAVSLMNKVVERFGRELRSISSRPDMVVGLLLRLILPYWDFESHEKGTFTLYSSVSYYGDGTEEIESFKELTRAISGNDVPVLTYG